MDKNYKKIAISLEEHWIEVIKNGHNPLIVALHGSQNYDLAYENSDIDTKCLIMPRFNDIVFNHKPISTTYIRYNDEHIDIKDIRLYFEQFWKQNIGFLEILFTPYVLLDNKFTPYWKELTSYKEDIARFNEVGAVKAMYGMAFEKYKALKYPYPTIKWKIDKWGYDGKLLHHILRIEEFIRAYIEGESFSKCLVSYPKYGKEFLLAAKKNEFSLEMAEKIANESMNIIQHMKDEFISTYSIYINNGVKTKVNDILYEIFKHYTKKELEEL